MNDLIELIEAMNYNAELDNNTELEALDGFELETITFEDYA